MKKLLIVSLSLIFLTTLFYLTVFSFDKQELADDFSNSSIQDVTINKDNLKILQLTDLHLTYGFDYLDRKTYKLIDTIIKQEKPDLIVFTGDLVMSIYAKFLIKDFIKKIDKYNIPYTFTFGNHEMEYHTMEQIVNSIKRVKTKNLIFHQGEKLSDDNTHGYSNFKIKINLTNRSFYIYMLDTKANRTDNVISDNKYDYLSLEQVDWFYRQAKLDDGKNLVFMHIPLVEFLDYEGIPNETIWTQGKNTGLFSKLVEVGKTLGVFVGHDHTNEFEFYKDNIMLAYGRNSGYNAYGTNKKGGRIIMINNLDNISTYLVGDSNE
ncbi:metallophosphoesterase [Haploplasma modicum]|uniref:metallophosphoesterase n=1 Tax=Haploplasma modicum TaxID=2150 RepID=UPI00047E7A15|nr:metallophosphoesterase [Haploplasma modicum]